jgi:hypothetical protein
MKLSMSAPHLVLRGRSNRRIGTASFLAVDTTAPAVAAVQVTPECRRRRDDGGGKSKKRDGGSEGEAHYVCKWMGVESERLTAAGGCSTLAEGGHAFVPTTRAHSSNQS